MVDAPSDADTGDVAALRERRLILVRRAAIAVWVIVVVFRTWTTGFAFNRELLLVYICAGLLAASIGRKRMLQVILDWLPFALVLVVYDLSRGAALFLGTPTWWQPQVDAERWLFFGVVPTVWLQEHLKLPHPPWWEVVMSTVYMSFFILPYVVAGVLWLRNRDDWKAFVRRFVVLQFAALIVYILLPAAPPWAAARCTPADVAGGPSDPPCMFRSARGVPDGGLLGAMSTSRPGAHQWVERISTRGWGTLHLNSAKSLIDEGQANVNLVAAIPSLHAALTAMVAAFLWRRVAAKWRPLLVAYPLIMAFLLVYTAEHYVFDILLGWLFAVIVLMALARLEARWQPGWWRRRPAPAAVAADRVPLPASPVDDGVPGVGGQDGATQAPGMVPGAAELVDPAVRAGGRQPQPVLDRHTDSAV
ncbi:phosphatase PAP2 family protein [Mycobacterium talmoniae]|nr:phosphatase PAP2 family protein [Mycobacterium eburneum]